MLPKMKILESPISYLHCGFVQSPISQSENICYFPFLRSACEAAASFSGVTLSGSIRTIRYLR